MAVIQTGVEVRAWMSNYIFLCDVITYPCHELGGGLGNLDQ